MPLTIPKSYRPAVLALLELPDDVTNSLVEALRSAHPAPYIRDLASRLSESLPLTYRQLYDILRMLAALINLQAEEELSPKDFSQRVTEVAAREITPTKQLDPSGWKTFTRRLTQLLEASGAL